MSTCRAACLALAGVLPDRRTAPTPAPEQAAEWNARNFLITRDRRPDFSEIMTAVEAMLSIRTCKVDDSARGVNACGFATFLCGVQSPLARHP